jgi:hypothetical protein
MTLEQILLTAFSGMLTFCGIILKLLWARSEACERWRAEKEPLITAMANKLGIAEATTLIVNGCHIEDCPYRGKLDTSYSLARKEEKRP